MSEPADEHLELPVDPDALARPVHFRLDAALLVALGGTVGTLLRYELAQLEPTRARSFPWGTFIANIVGAFLLGVLLEWLARAGPDRGRRQRARLLLGTGFCGGLTTYSTLAVEADLLVRAHDSTLAVAYLAATLIAGGLASVAGIAAAAGHHRLRRRQSSS
ncbi:CrcB family protein [uncultured Jatrophihabitans sp.]|uniref:FluC/FEX family fluoride channel n=1 Tax=uncultured Jatrophihabitans sp. TaxID=1610747 RepID=UPI0035CCA4A1